MFFQPLFLTDFELSNKKRYHCTPVFEGSIFLKKKYNHLVSTKIYIDIMLNFALSI